jgi:hypothetical protein
VYLGALVAGFQRFGVGNGRTAMCPKMTAVRLDVEGRSLSRESVDCQTPIWHSAAVGPGCMNCRIGIADPASSAAGPEPIASRLSHGEWTAHLV